MHSQHSDKRSMREPMRLSRLPRQPLRSSCTRQNLVSSSRLHASRKLGLRSIERDQSSAPLAESTTCLRPQELRGGLHARSSVVTPMDPHCILAWNSLSVMWVTHYRCV